MVAQSLKSSLGFQDDPQLLVIDELQFLLRRAAITFDQRKTLRDNIIEAHRRLLLEPQKTPGALKEERTEGVSGPLPVTVRRYEFSPLTRIRDLLEAMYGAHATDEFSVTYRGDDSKLTSYYNQDFEAGPQIFGSALEGSVAQSLLLWTELLQGASAPLARIAGTTNASTRPSRDPPYLELVLHKSLRNDSATIGPPGSEFQDVAGNPFIYAACRRSMGIHG